MAVYEVQWRGRVKADFVVVGGGQHVALRSSSLLATVPRLDNNMLSHEHLSGFNILDRLTARPVRSSSRLRTGAFGLGLGTGARLTLTGSGGAERPPPAPRRPSKMPRIQHVRATHPKVIGRENVRLLEAVAELWLAAASGRSQSEEDDDWMLLTMSQELESPVAPVPPHLLAQSNSLSSGHYGLDDSVAASKALKTSASSSDRGPLLFDCPEDFELGLDLDDVYPVPVWQADATRPASEAEPGMSALASASDDSLSPPYSAMRLSPPFGTDLSSSSYTDSASLLTEDLVSMAASPVLASPPDIDTFSKIHNRLPNGNNKLDVDSDIVLLECRGVGLGLSSSKSSVPELAPRTETRRSSPLSGGWMSIADPWTGLVLM